MDEVIYPLNIGLYCQSATVRMFKFHGVAVFFDAEFGSILSLKLRGGPSFNVFAVGTVYLDLFNFVRLNVALVLQNNDRLMPVKNTKFYFKVALRFI